MDSQEVAMDAGNTEEPPVAAAAAVEAGTPAPPAEPAAAAADDGADGSAGSAVSTTPARLTSDVSTLSAEMPMSPLENLEGAAELPSKGEAPAIVETTPAEAAAIAAASAADQAEEEAAEAAKTLLFWLEAKIAIPETGEEVVLGESSVKYKMHVNKAFHRAYDYRDFTEFRLGLQKVPEIKAKLASFPTFPGKTMGTAGPKTVADRQLKLAAWFQAAVQLPQIASHELFADFVMQEVDYDKVEVELKRRVIQLESLPEEQWKLSCEKSGVQICSTKLEGSSYLAIRSRSMVRAPLEHAWQIYLDKEAWAHWQPDMKVCKTIEVIRPGEPDGTGFAEAFYVLYNVPVVTNRDISLYSSQIKGCYSDPDNQDKRQITSRSIKHPKMGPTKKNVRGECEVSRTVFTRVMRETKSGKKVETVELETMMHMNIKGNIPASVINIAVANATDDVAKMCTYMQQEYAKKRQAAKKVEL